MLYDTYFESPPSKTAISGDDLVLIFKNTDITGACSQGYYLLSGTNRLLLLVSRQFPKQGQPSRLHFRRLIEGRKEHEGRRFDGGRKEGKWAKEGRKDGRTEGRTDGRTDGRKIEGERKEDGRIYRKEDGRI